ncbi:translation initiation factor eIF 4e-like domain-containing protein, partial [Dimargaris cristalligena]
SNYEQFLKTVCLVDTVQGFWGAVNNMKGPDKLEVRQSYHFMKEGIKPTWEDPRNQNGGSYVFRIKTAQTPEVWRDLLMLLVGEQLQDCISSRDEICGVSVSRRWNTDLFQIWH